MLLIACYLGSIPIVPDLTVFNGLGEDQGVLRVDGSWESYENAILVANERATRMRLPKSLDDYCERRFTPKQTHDALTKMASNRRLDAADVLSRMRSLVIETSGMALSAEARGVVMKKEYDLSLADKDRELHSRSYQLALKIRKCADYTRATLKRLRLS